jgi:hypothetical protein
MQSGAGWDLPARRTVILGGPVVGPSQIYLRQMQKYVSLPADEQRQVAHHFLFFFGSTAASSLLRVFSRDGSLA